MNNRFDLENKINKIESEIINPRDKGLVLMDLIMEEYDNAKVDEKNLFIDYFLEKIENAKGYWHMFLYVLVKLNLKEVGQRLYNIYIKEERNKEQVWKDEVIQTLLKLHFPEVNDFYKKYIMNFYNDNELSGQKYSFFILSFYTNVNSKDSINLLSEYFVKHYISDNAELKDFVNNNIGYLMHSFLENKDYTIQLLEKIAEIDIRTALYLKSIIKKFLCSDNCSHYDSKVINEKLKLLDERCL